MSVAVALSDATAAFKDRFRASSALTAFTNAFGPHVPRRLFVVFGLQTVAGLQLLDDADAPGPLQIVAVCFLIGIARAWEMIGGPHNFVGGTKRLRPAASRAPG